MTHTHTSCSVIAPSPPPPPVPPLPRDEEEVRRLSSDDMANIRFLRFLFIEPMYCMPRPKLPHRRVTATDMSRCPATDDRSLLGDDRIGKRRRSFLAGFFSPGYRAVIMTRPRQHRRADCSGEFSELGDFSNFDNKMLLFWWSRLGSVPEPCPC